jgi:hypothetical protein
MAAGLLPCAATLPLMPPSAAMLSSAVSMVCSHVFFCSPAALCRLAVKVLLLCSLAGICGDAAPRCAPQFECEAVQPALRSRVFICSRRWHEL